MKIKISAIEKYLPKKRLSSKALDLMAEGSPGRIEKNTGVRFRHHVSGDETVTEMGAIVLQRALEKAHLRPADIDLLIFAGASFDYPVPHNSVIIKSKITDDADHFACLDIDTTCLSFLNALDVAHLYLEAGRYTRIAIVCSEIASKALTPQDEKVFGLFGDAAVAMILETSERGYQNTYVDFQNFPSGAMMARVPIGGAIQRGIQSDPADPGYYFQMDGKNLIRLTIKHLDAFVAKMEKESQTKIEHFDHIVAHQTSKFGNEYFQRHFQLDPARVIETLSEFGNCISAAIPLGLEHLLKGHLHLDNKTILLLGAGAGLSLGAMVLEFDSL